ncbi:MAG: hypothetical protein PHS79_02725 [Patescibacteria group bacterium]|nr:hypothetical protein [Patescibacteria group bacterium]
MIKFIKTLAYPLTPPSGEIFSYLCKLTSQRMDPPSLYPNTLETDSLTIFHSPLQRVVSSLNKREGQRFVVRNELREIPFKLDDLCSREEWMLYRSAIVRRRFVQFFVEDRLTLRRDMIENEIQNLLTQITSVNNEVTVVSHSFRLKIIEAYIKTSGGIFLRPQTLADWIMPGQKTYGWGEGFEINRDDIISIPKSSPL